MGAKLFGARVRRLEDPALLVGRGRFVDDVKLPGVLHACFVRSPHAHARLRGIDIKPAMSIPGVHAVLTADDLPQPMRSKPMPMLLPNPAIMVARTQTVLARDEVHYVGQPVTVVTLLKMRPPCSSSITTFLTRSATAAMRSRTAPRAPTATLTPTLSQNLSRAMETLTPPLPTPRTFLMK